MSDEPKQEELQDVEQETAAEAKPGKKPKAAKKKAAESQAEESAAAETPAAEEPAPVAAAAAAVSADSAPPARAAGPFEEGVQALLRAEYDAADNFFGQALTNSRKNGDQAGQVAALEQLGHLCYLRGAVPQAQDYYRQASSLRGV